LTNSDPNNQTEPTETRPQRILIGSQRDPAAYRARRRRDWTPLPEAEGDSEAPAEKEEPESPAGASPTPVEQPRGGSDGLAIPGTQPVDQEPPPCPQPAAEQSASPEHAVPHEDSNGGPRRPDQSVAQPQQPPGEETVAEEPVLDKAVLEEIAAELKMSAEPGTAGPFPPPNLRERLSPDLEEEYHRVLSDAVLDDLLAVDEALSRQPLLEAESQHAGRVVAVRRDDVFVELGGREQGIVPLKQFDQPPQPGTPLEVIVQRFNPEDGLYELTMPNTAVEVDDWADLHEGMLVEARVTGHNTGGLECEVNHLRGFIPISQVSLYRVEDLAQFADQKFTCLVTEANPQRRNLVLSRRAVLEREKEEARQKLLDSLQPGQIHEGVVRKLLDFGAFVELGSGVDGLLHVSQVAWGRVEHPSEVLSEGQKVRVKIEKVNRANGKISLAYRDLLENPWTKAAEKYPANSVVRGKVTNLMEFGAFVELEPGVEGLVHISELSHKRVWRTSDVVTKGQEVEVLVLSVDPEAQRISLSMKALSPEPEPAQKEEEPADEAVPKRPPRRKKPDQPLQGGLGRSSAGKKFGLKW
jgi:predicted RNA-binding protein with RPS1 domain